MGWERRKKGASSGYFYRSVRIGDTVKKVYYGRGAAAHEAATALERRRKDRKEATKLIQDVLNVTDESDKLATELREWAEVLLSTWLILTGHHKHRGQWRKTVARKPRVGSQAWRESLDNNPTYIKNTILDLAKRAEGGNKEAVEKLNTWLVKHPEMRSLVRGLDDLATKVERAYAQRLCGTDELSKKAVGDDLATMKAELLGPSPSVTDRILVAAVLVAYLSFQIAALGTTQPSENQELRTAREKLLTIAQKRLHDAIRAWELHSGKKALGLRPVEKIGLFDPEAGDIKTSDAGQS